MAFSFAGSNLALDFVGTLNERRTDRVENLLVPADVGRWLHEAGVLDAEPDVDDETLASAVALREALFAVVERLLDAPDEALPAAALAVVNEAAARPGPTLTLRADRSVGRTGSWRAGLTAVARDGLTLAEPGEGVLKWCAEPTCTHPFLDRSRGHRRRWCEMAGCGDRAKAAAYRARRRASGAGTQG